MSLRVALRSVAMCLRHGVDGKVHVLSCRQVAKSDKPRAVCGLAALVWLSTAAPDIDCAKCALWADMHKSSDRLVKAIQKNGKLRRKERKAREKAERKPPAVDHRRCASCREPGRLSRRPDTSGVSRWFHVACWTAGKVWDGNSKEPQEKT